MIGFVILSHRSPGQLFRLCQTLGQLYGDPPIACHHDFTQRSLDMSKFPPNVRFVVPPITTAWANWSLIEATLAALSLLYDGADPDVFYVISAADYPTARPEKVRADLARSGADVHIDAFPLRAALRGNIVVGDPHLVHHRTHNNLLLGRGRYLDAQVRIPIVRLRAPPHSTTIKRYPRLGRLTKTLPFASPLSPFGQDYECYVGSQWFTGNRKAAKKLLSPSVRDRKLQHFYRSRVVPDESYFQTVLCNDRSLLCENQTFRYADWKTDQAGAHPMELTIETIPAIVESGAHFSRKFRECDPVLDRIDRLLKLKS